MNPRRLTSTLLAAALAAGVLAACQPKSVDQIQVVRTSAGSGEFSMAAAPPNAGCPADTGVVLGTWGDTYVGGHGLTPEFTAIGQGVGVTIPQDDQFPYTPPGSTGTWFLREFTRLLGDPQLVRLTDGRLLLLHMAFRGWPFERKLSDGSSVVSANTTSQPGDVFGSWEEYLRVQELAKGPVGDHQADFGRWAIAHRQRSEQVFFESSDCGKTWALHSRIDANDVLDGKCAAPRRLPVDENDKASYVVRGDGVEEQRYWPGGWDRPELYVDPWSGDTFTTMNCKAGENEETSGVFMFRLPKGSSTWEAFPYASHGGGGGQAAWVPSSMTSTKSGALWVATCTGSVLHVHRRATSGLGAWESTTVGASGSCAGAGTYAGDGLVLLHTVSIARSAADSVRVMYPTVVDGRTTFRRANVIHKGFNQFTVVEGAAIKPLKNDASLMNARFVEYDQTIAKEDKPVYDAIAYWMESSPGDQRVVVRSSVVTAGINFAKPVQLDTWNVQRPDANWGVDSDGNGDNWDDHDGQYWAGDYWGGASYCEDGAVTFLAGWAAQNQDNDGHGHDLSVAKIRLKERKCKANVLPTPSGQTVPTTASTLAGAPPPPSSTSSSSSSSSSSSTSSSSTTAPPSTTTSTRPGSTVAPQPNRVTGISLTMGTCTSVNRQWQCPGTATFSLSGGGAPGAVAWDVLGTIEHSCTETDPFVQPQPSFTAAAGQTSASRPVTLIFPSNQQPNGKSASVKTSVAQARHGSLQSGPAQFTSQGGCTKP